MKNFKSLLLICLIFTGIILYLFSLDNQISISSLENDSPANISIRADSPIDIRSNSDIASYASQGAGSKADPYIIENKVIDGGSSYCISIQNTDAFFILRNCEVFNGIDGIHLVNVSNGKLMTNTVYNNSDAGISLDYSDNCTVSGNTASNNIFGISLDYSDNCTVSGNTASNNIFGIDLVSSGNCAVSGNTANNNSGDGIDLSFSDNCTVSGNTANNNSYDGILLYQSNDNFIRNNTLIDNCYGIDEVNCKGNTLENNTIQNRQCEKDIPGFIGAFTFIGLFIIILFMKNKYILHEEREIFSVFWINSTRYPYRSRISSNIAPIRVFSCS